MSVRKRTWVTRRGETKTAWITDYVDQRGERHIKTFSKKKDADAHHATVRVDVRQGIHTPENRSITVAQAADDWIRYVELENRERSTVAGYRQHVDQHIVPRIGREKLAKLTTPRIEALRDDLLRDLSRPLARKVLGSLKAMLKDAKRRGNVAQNVAADVKIATDKRGNGKLAVGIDIPTPAEIKAIIDDAWGRWRPLLIVAAFTGLRSSELRGLRWQDVDLQRGELHVRQRADRWGTIGDPKSASSDRTIPLGPFVVNTLKEWKLRYPRPLTGERDADGKLLREPPRPAHLVFANGSGHVENHGNIIQRGLWPAQIAGGVTVPVLDASGKPKRDEEGEPVLAPKYSGLHTLRHFYASWCINRRADGGLELPIKVVQERLGHSSIVMTSDVYGHLFPRRDDGAELAAAEQALMAPHAT